MSAALLVPGATFLRADATTLELPPESFDAVVCLYALIHVPLDEQQKIAIDLVRHRWAGMDVMVKLRATDAAGHTGESKEVAYKLPEKIRMPAAIAQQAYSLTGDVRGINDAISMPSP